MLLFCGVDVDRALEQGTAGVEAAHHQRGLLWLANNDHFRNFILVPLEGKGAVAVQLPDRK